MQFLRVCQIANLCRFRAGYLPKDFIFIRGAEFLGGIEVLAGWNPESCHVINWFKGIFDVRGLANLDIELPLDFKWRYNDGMLATPLSFDELVLHIHEMDPIGRGSCLNCGQPPCSYYVDIISRRNWSKVTILARDSRNPCLRLVKPLGSVRMGESWEGDLRLMLIAKNLAIGSGSAGYMAVVVHTCSHVQMARFAIGLRRENLEG